MNNMFDGMNMLAEITLGKNFFFNGKKCWLPTPSDAYIPGVTGKWYDNKGNEYAVEDVPDNMKATYYAVKPGL